MKLLITGASGFVGKVMCKALLGREYEVRAVYRTQHGIENNIQPILVPNINVGTNWDEAVKGLGMVVHLAARAHILTDLAVNPLEEFRKTNTEGTLNLANSAARAGVKRFVFVSSIGVNGSGSVTPFTERSTPNPSEPYAVSKLEAEHGLREIAAHTGMEVVIVRPPLVYGADCPGNFLRLLNLIYKGFPLPLGGVNNRRSLIGVDNLADFLVQCIEHPAAANKTLLVADEPDISTPDLIRILAKGMNRPARLMPVSSKLVGATAKLVGKQATFEKLCGNLQIDSSFSRQALCWNQPMSLEDGLFRVGRWYSSYMTTK